jgi:hypothetical protein
LGSFPLSFSGKAATHLQKSIHCGGRQHPA